MMEKAGMSEALFGTYVQMEGRSDYTGVLRRVTDEEAVWYCKHGDHETPDKATECARRELRRRRRQLSDVM
jgi:hypothetical protein